MKAAWRRNGEKYVLEIDAEIFRECNFDPDVQWEIEKIGNAIVLFPSESRKDDAEFERIVEEIMDRYDESLRMLS